MYPTGYHGAADIPGGGPVPTYPLSASAKDVGARDPRVTGYDHSGGHPQTASRATIPLFTTQSLQRTRALAPAQDPGCAAQVQTTIQRLQDNAQRLRLLVSERENARIAALDLFRADLPPATEKHILPVLSQIAAVLPAHPRPHIQRPIHGHTGSASSAAAARALILQDSVGHGLDAFQEELFHDAMHWQPDGQCPLPGCEHVCADENARREHLREPAVCPLCRARTMYQDEFVEHLEAHVQMLYLTDRKTAVLPPLSDYVTTLMTEPCQM
ncbi:hypothetical protein AURDEDRAFT_172694 [Auricularia subglabra TFB-10046 SS5]|nr:hypothetical protein AURDEDRAFT_172694 [Auricularia subglabra TFB-10046 SS5]